MVTIVHASDRVLRRTIAATVLFVLGCAACLAQTNGPNTAPPVDPLLQLMISQPSIDVSTNVEIAAVFDPPVVRPGDRAVWRVTINALTDSVEWPGAVPFPPGLVATQSARGLIFIPAEGKLKPQTGINYHVRPDAEGSFTVSAFDIQVYGRTVQVPASKLEVSSAAPAAVPQSLVIETAQTNVYMGQAVEVSVLLKSAPGSPIQGVQDVKLNGDGFLVDLGSARQSISVMPGQGGGVPAYTYSTVITPLRSGDIALTAQGFTAGNRFSGAIIIQGQVTIPGGPPQFQLLDSEPVVLRARPLPRTGELPGFKGAIGVYSNDPPHLSTNRIRAGEVVRLSVAFRGEGNLTRLAPPDPPVSSNWQVFAAQRGTTDLAPGAALTLPANSAIFTFRMIPLNTDVKETPAIPFSFFDPERGAFVDATIPPMPIQVLPGESMPDARVMAALVENSAADTKKLRLADIVERPGRTASSLVPLQHRRWFMVVQAVPVIGLIALWQWDRRRRFHELHPEVLIRRRARRAFRRERRVLRAAFEALDETRYINAAVSAIRIAAAPEQSAEPRALVMADVLPALEGNGETKELVRRLFAAADAAGFARDPQRSAGVLQLDGQLQRVLDQLEAKL